jgi:hypothetical protein
MESTWQAGSESPPVAVATTRKLCRGRHRNGERVVAAGRVRCHRQPRRIVAGRGVEPVAIAAMRKMEFLLLRCGHEQRLCRLRPVPAAQVVAVGRRRDHGRDRNDCKRDHDFDQGEAGGGTRFRHEVLTGSPA